MITPKRARRDFEGEEIFHFDTKHETTEGETKELDSVGDPTALGLAGIHYKLWIIN